MFMDVGISCGGWDDSQGASSTGLVRSGGQKSITHIMYTPTMKALIWTLRMIQFSIFGFRPRKRMCHTVVFNITIFFSVSAFIYYSWRVQSFQHAWKQRDSLELFLLFVDYVWLFSLPWKVSIASILLGGFLVGLIVTATHQSEPLVAEETSDEYDFVKIQFESTRNAYSPVAFTNWLWGGMQYQLEHHLFPTMPKYKYALISDRVREWAKNNGLNYRVDTVPQIIKRNLETLRNYSRSCQPHKTKTISKTITKTKTKTTQ